MIARFKAWRESRRLKSAEWVLSVLINKKDPRIFNQIRGIAKIMAMKELDKANLNHCVRCPETRPLRNINGFYMCETHYKDAYTESKEQVKFNAA